MKDPSNSQIPQKASFVLNLILVGFIVIVLRSWHLGFLLHEEKEEEARRPQIKTVIEPANRGAIRDRFQEPIALNQVKYNAALLYSQLTSIPAVTYETDKEGKKIKRHARKDYITALSQMLGDELHLDPERVEDLIYSKAAFYCSVPFVLKEDLTEKEYYRLKMLEREWLGIQALKTSKRVYPQGRCACDIVGYMGAINREEYEAVLQEIRELKQCLKQMESHSELLDNSPYYTPDEIEKRIKELTEKAYTVHDYVGKSGVEAQFEEDLRGFHGKKKFYSDARGNFLRKLPDSFEPKSGETITLSISIELQRFAEKLLARNESIRKTKGTARNSSSTNILVEKQPWIKGGAIVAMDPVTGEILAMASFPRYDPNDFIKSGSQEVQKQKQKNIQRWFETEKHISDIWDGKALFQKEEYDDLYDEFVDKSQPLTWQNYLKIILPEENPVRLSFTAKKTIKEAVYAQNAALKLQERFPEYSFYNVLNALYKDPEHESYPEKLSKKDREAILDIQKRKTEEVEALKAKLDKMIARFESNYDKVLYLDLCKLAVNDSFFDEDLLRAVSSQSIDDYLAASKAMSCIKAPLEEIVRDQFHEEFFLPWRKKEGSAYLKQKRLLEKEQKKIAKPYLEYFDAFEEEQFRLFWESNRWTFFYTFLTGSYKEGNEEITSYLKNLSGWHKEIIKGANSALEWFQSFISLAETLSSMNEKIALKYLRSLRSFSDLERPLFGRYRGLRNGSKTPLEKDLAAAFYPRYGFGYGRSQAYRQAATQGSIFKIIPAYEALMQRLKKSKVKITSYSELNPLIIVDRHIKEGDQFYVGMTEEGKLIPRLYKGGRIPKSLSRNLGKIDLLKAIETSSNPYFSLLAGDVIESPKDLERAARDFSYGEKTGIALPQEIKGKMPDDLESNLTGLYATAIGQHTLVVTPLQSAVMLSSFANGGHVLQPDILLKKDKPIPVRDVLMPSYVRKIILDGMKRVVVKTKRDCLNTLSRIYRDYPEAISDYIDLKEDLIGKTSTSEAVEQVDLDQKFGVNLYNHVWFGGISFLKESEAYRAPISKDIYAHPDLVVVVYLKYGGYGKESAPIAAQVVKKWREINSR